MIYASFVRYFPFDMGNCISWESQQKGNPETKYLILSNHTINENSFDLIKWQHCTDLSITYNTTIPTYKHKCWVYKTLVMESRALDCCFILPLISQKQSLTLAEFWWMQSQFKKMDWQFTDSLQTNSNYNHQALDSTVYSRVPGLKHYRI